MTRISVAAPILNEARHIDLWWQCVGQFANEVVITDGGSTDGTLTEIFEAQYLLPKIEWDISARIQTGEPYSPDWNEGAVRNDLLSRVTGDYCVLLDADELVSPLDVKLVMGMMEFRNAPIAYLRWVTFWGDTSHVRVNTWRDRRWNGVWVPRIIKMGAGVHYDNKKHHCRLHGGRRVYVDVPLFHMHYAYGPDGLKKHDNRRFDFGDKPVNRPVVREWDGAVPE